MFQIQGPQHEPCGHPLVTLFCIFLLLTIITAFLSLK
jgi:hypothetical protein